MRSLSQTAGAHCSIARALDIVGDAWALLIIRDAMIEKSTRFQDFVTRLGIAPNILTKRLASLVESGVMTRRSYRPVGERARDEYVLTESGRALTAVIGALAAWGRTYVPDSRSTSPQFFDEETGTVATLQFVTETGAVIEPERLTAVRTPDAA